MTQETTNRITALSYRIKDNAALGDLPAVVEDVMEALTIIAGEVDALSGAIDNSADAMRGLGDALDIDDLDREPEAAGGDEET